MSELIINDPERRKAPPGQFRVVAYDSLDNTDWVDGDFPSMNEALKHAREQTLGSKMLVMYIYNQAGDYVGHSGKYQTKKESAAQSTEN